MKWEYLVFVIVFGILLALALALAFSGLVSGYNIEGGGVCNCNTCDDCELALNDAVDCTVLVKLTADITGQAGTCIDNPQGI